MSRCRLGSKKLKKYSQKFGIKFVAGLVRGNTNHRVDLFSEDKKEYVTFPDGKLYELNGAYNLKEVEL